MFGKVHRWQENVLNLMTAHILGSFCFQMVDAYNYFLWTGKSTALIIQALLATLILINSPIKMFMGGRGVQCTVTYPSAVS